MSAKARVGPPRRAGRTSPDLDLPLGLPPLPTPDGRDGLARRILAAPELLTCVFHAGCADGLCAAYALLLGLPPAAQALVRDRLASLGDPSGRRYDAAGWRAAGAPLFLSAPPQGPPLDPDLVRGRNVVYVDTAPRAEALDALCASALQVVILDHHASSRDLFSARALPPNATFVHSDLLAGVEMALAWAAPWLRGSAGTGGVVAPDDVEARGAAHPLLDVFAHVADHDLWRHALPESRAVNSALTMLGTTRSFAGLLRAGRVDDALAARGRDFLLVERELVVRAAASAAVATARARLPGDDAARTYGVLLVCSSVLQSELCDLLMASAPAGVHFAVAWYVNHGSGAIHASARTTRPDVDLSVIVPNLQGAMPGGGGHPQAAGFRILGTDIARAFTLG